VLDQLGERNLFERVLITSKVPQSLLVRTFAAEDYADVRQMMVRSKVSDQLST